jgi:hypothetical protein
MSKLAIGCACVLAAILVASLASAQSSIGLNITKTAPLAGTGSSGAPLKLTLCAANEVYQVNAGGTAFECAAAGGSYTAGDGITLTASDFDLDYTSDFTITGGQLDTSGTFGLTGTLSAVGTCSLATTAGSYLNVGRDVNGTTDAQNGIGLKPEADGNNYVDFKTATSGSTTFRYGSGTGHGYDNNWLALNHATGAVTLHNTATVTGLLTATAGVTTPANLTTTGTGDLTVADDATIGDVLDVNGLAKFGAASDGATYISNDIIAGGYSTNAEADLAINYFGYQAGTTQFRNLKIYDGKNALAATFTGSTKLLDVVGGGTTAANWTTTSTGDLVSADDLTVGDDATITGDLAVTGATTVADFRGTIISPTAITGAVNDWSPTGLSTATVIRVSASAEATLSGITGGAAGRMLTLINVGAENILIVNETASTAANRITTVGDSGETWTLLGGRRDSVTLIYSGATSRWEQYESTTRSRLHVTGSTVLGDAVTDTITANGTLGFSGTDVSVSSGTCTITGEAQSFQVTTTGELAAAATCVIALNRTFNAAPYCTISGADADSIPLTVFVTASTTAVTITADSTTLTASVFNVLCPDRF